MSRGKFLCRRNGVTHTLAHHSTILEAVGYPFLVEWPRNLGTPSCPHAHSEGLRVKASHELLANAKIVLFRSPFLSAQPFSSDVIAYPSSCSLSYESCLRKSTVVSRSRGMTVTNVQ